MKNHLTLWLSFAVLLLYALDQVSKWCIVTWFIPPHPQTGAVMDRLPVLQGNGVLNFDLIHIHNTVGTVSVSRRPDSGFGRADSPLQ